MLKQYLKQEGWILVKDGTKCHECGGDGVEMVLREGKKEKHFHNTCVELYVSRVVVNRPPQDEPGQMELFA